MKTIKVQIIGGISTKSIVKSGFDKIQHPLTFHAYSDAMKARVLESYLKNPDKFVLSFTDETPCAGEWHEPLVQDNPAKQSARAVMYSEQSAQDAV
jgi:hypothetical protein